MVVVTRLDYNYRTHRASTSNRWHFPFGAMLP